MTALKAAFKVGDRVQRKGEPHLGIMTVIEIREHKTLYQEPVYLLYVCQWKSGDSYPFGEEAIELVDAPEEKWSSGFVFGGR